jgi:endonuclease-3
MSSFGERSAGLKKVCRALRKAYGKQVFEPVDDVALELLRFLLAEETDQASVAKVLKRFTEEFVDLNEVRVSFPREIAAVMPEVAHAEQKASRATRLFNAIFLSHNTMTWEFLRTLGVRELRQLFEKLDGGGEVLGAAAVMLLSGGHAVPADADVVRVLSRLGLTAEGEDAAALQGFLERAVTREQGYETWALMHRLGESVCLPAKPQCAKCPVRTMCPTGREMLAVKKSPASKASGKAGAKASTAGKAKKKAPAASSATPPGKKKAAKSPTSATSSKSAPARRPAPTKRKK